MIDEDGHIIQCRECGNGNWVYKLSNWNYACQRHGWQADCRKVIPMHDINGKSLHVGSEVYSYGFGLCKIIEVKEEDNVEKQGALVVIQNDKGKTFEARTRAAYMHRTRTWKELAQASLDVQNASNLSGVVHAFSEVIGEVRHRLDGEGKGGTDNTNQHPVCLLWADKIASLTNTQTMGHSLVTKAYEWAYDVSGGHKLSKTA